MLKDIISALKADMRVNRLRAPLCLMEQACVRGTGVWTCPQTADVKEVREEQTENWIWEGVFTYKEGGTLYRSVQNRKGRKEGK